MGTRVLSVIMTICLVPQLTLAADRNLGQELSGRILLQVENAGQAWYVNPVNQRRYYMPDGQSAYNLMRSLGLGITDADLSKLPTVTNRGGDQKLVDRLKGRIVLQVQQHGEAWYINPADGLRYYLKDGDAAYQVMRSLSLGITNADLTTITTSDDQNSQDLAFADVAYVKYASGEFETDYYGDEILPPASMTKLMTAIIIAEQAPDWQKKVTITQSILDYPKIFVGNDATSEVAFQVGDTISTYDLLVALLVASSNQSAAALIDSSGMSRVEFVEAMNVRAQALGLTKTHFEEAAGLSTGTLTTAKEMVRIAEKAFSLPAIQSVYAKDSHDIFVVDAKGEFRKISVTDRNFSLRQFNPDATKTGYLIEAQRTVVLKKGDVIVVMMHARSMDERNAILTKLLN